MRQRCWETSAKIYNRCCAGDEGTFLWVVRVGALLPKGLHIGVAAALFQSGTTWYGGVAGTYLPTTYLPTYLPTSEAPTRGCAGYTCMISELNIGHAQRFVFAGVRGGSALGKEIELSAEVTVGCVDIEAQENERKAGMGRDAARQVAKRDGIGGQGVPRGREHRGTGRVPRGKGGKEEKGGEREDRGSAGGGRRGRERERGSMQADKEERDGVARDRAGAGKEGGQVQQAREEVRGNVTKEQGESEYGREVDAGHAREGQLRRRLRGITKDVDAGLAKQNGNGKGDDAHTE
ncbi:hypothetical protein C8R45DRAFT_1189589 [Mycena sanguinolenta]|nr:hypothetical protein C8R45DRAFT_1189589 [Mycena sanguinolenta]